MQKNSIEILLPNPLVIVHKDFINKEICKNIINQHKDEKEYSAVTDGEIKNFSKLRKSFTAFLDEFSEGSVAFKARIESIFTINKQNLETIQFTKYKKNGVYKAHYDAFEHEKNQKQRLYTFILYLNNDFSGGETFFNKLNLEVKPETGMLLCFSNCISETKYLNPFMEHESRTIKDGTKYILSTWATESINLP